MKATYDRRRIVAIIALVCVVGGLAAGFSSGLVSCSPAREGKGARPLSAAEAQRLGDMRARNYRDARVGLRATVGNPGTALRLSGWVDWRRPLAYLAATTSVPGPDDGLLQAVPGIVATRPGRVDGDPPAVPPADGWRVRPFTTASDSPAVIDAFLALLFSIASERPDQADLLARTEARWLGRERYRDQTVDVLMGPAVPPRATPSGKPSASGKPSQPRKPFGKPSASRKASATPAGPLGPASPTPSPGSLAALGGAIKYWLDGDARLHRFEALLAKDMPVTVELRRDNQPELVAVDAFGGRSTAPRKVTAKEAAVLAAMGQLNRKAGGGEITISVPTLSAGSLRGRGWLDWRGRTAYFGVHEIDKPEKRVLMRMNQRGVFVREKGAGRGDALPPVPPAGGGWQFASWAQRGRSYGTLDLDMLVGEALAVSSSRRENAKRIREVAQWLRTDTLGGAPVTVYEIARPGGAGGQARVRYWVDRSGGLRRLELRTLSGAYAQLDIEPGRVPKLG